MSDIGGHENRCCTWFFETQVHFRVQKPGFTMVGPGFLHFYPRFAAARITFRGKFRHNHKIVSGASLGNENYVPRGRIDLLWVWLTIAQSPLLKDFDVKTISRSIESGWYNFLLFFPNSAINLSTLLIPVSLTLVT